MDELLKIHYPATDNKSPSCTAFKIMFDREKFLWEMNYAKDNLILPFANSPLTETENKSLDKVFTDLCEFLHQQPKRISHRDYHSRNLMLKLGKTRVIDFQDARLGPVQYDLVSLLYDSYVNLDQKIQSEILDYYLDKAKADHGAQYDMDEFLHCMQIQRVQRCFKACGSFSSFYNNREDRRYLHYIQPTLAAVVNTLVELNKYPDFVKILEDKGLFEVDFESL